MLGDDAVLAVAGLALILGGLSTMWAYVSGKYEGYCTGYRAGRQSREQ